MKEPLSMYESVAELPEFVGTAWRAESGYWHAPGTTVADIIRFEREELGNEYPDISDKLLQNLDHYSASAAVWVNRRRKDCLWYLSEGESEEAVGRVQLPKGSKIITPDYCGGYLVLRGLAEPMLRGLVMAEPWQMTRVEWKNSPQGMQAELTPLQWRLYKDDDKWIRGTHENLIHNALVEGKPVPQRVLAEYPDLARRNPGDERLLKVAIEREPLRVAKQWGYEVHRLSPKDVVDKDDYARGYRYRLSKADPTQPYPQIVMARSEGEVATFLKRQVEGNPDPATEYWRELTELSKSDQRKIETSIRPKPYTDYLWQADDKGRLLLNQEGRPLMAKHKYPAAYQKRLLGGGNPISESAEAKASVGTCYEDAWRFVIKEEEGELIHGSVESKGKRIGHAWVELPTGFIWEPETGKYFTREAFNIAASPIEEHRYTVEEAAIMLARVGKHGPWIEEEKQRILGGNPMPRTESERLSFHERIFGKGSTPPLERLRRGQTVNDMLPMPPESGPPLPRALGLRWPWKK